MGTPGTSSERSRRRLEPGRQRLSQAARRHAAVRLAVELARRDRAASGSVLAAALATRIFTWALPFALLSTALLGFLGASSDSLARLTDRLIPDPALRELLARAAEQAAEGRYVTGCLGVVLLIVATVPLGRTMDAVVTGVWGVSRPGAGARLRRASRYGAALAGIAATHVAAVVVRGGPVSDAVTAAATFGAFLLLAGAMLGVHGGPRGTAQGAVLVAAGIEAMRLVGFYYLPHKLQRSSELYGTLGHRRSAAAVAHHPREIDRPRPRAERATVRPAVCRDTQAHPCPAGRAVRSRLGSPTGASRRAASGSTMGSSRHRIRGGRRRD